MRFLPIPLLAIGTVLGYGFAFHSMHHHRDHRAAWESHVADVCVGAARHVRGDNVKSERAKGTSVESDPPAPAESKEP
jgi:hypothetical protein